MSSTTAPEQATFVTNLYSCETELFVTNSDETILSQEVTKQGGPELILVYVVDTILLAIKREDEDLKKIFYGLEASTLYTWDPSLAIGTEAVTRIFVAE